MSRRNKISAVTLMIPYYENPNMLREHINQWQEYSPEVAERLLIIIVDDGSPHNPAKGVLSKYDLAVKVQLYRIQENIPWNFTGAKNLGFHVAPEGWVFSIDIDHTVPAESMTNLFSTILYPKYFYRPVRYAMYNGEQLRLHGLTFIITRKLFWKAGGYDERFAGQRFVAAGLMGKALRRTAKSKVLESVYINYYNKNIIPDCSTQDWTRDPVLSKKLRRGGEKGDRLRFKWGRVT